jgi:hypothetical protein
VQSQIDIKRKQAAHSNLQIRKVYKEMYARTQKTLNDNIIVDADREERKMLQIREELYTQHRCQERHDSLAECWRKSSEFCLEEVAQFDTCVSEH